MPAAALRHPRVRPEPASKERVVKLRQKMSAGNRRVLFVPLPASFLWARILVKKWTRSAAAQRARRPCPAGLKLALGQGEHVASRSSGSRFAESPGAQGPGGSTPDPPATPQGMPRNAPWRHHPSRPQRERRPPPPPRPNRHRVANNRGRLAPVADSCANSEIAARRARRSVLSRLFAIGPSAVLH
jgi:hypothetical protein